LNLLPCVVCGGASVSGGGVRRQAKALEDRCPTEDELRVAKSYVKQLDDMTREDHLRSIDELLAQVPLHLPQTQLRRRELLLHLRRRLRYLLPTPSVALLSQSAALRGAVRLVEHT
jgi:hypothetical protein